MQDSTPEVDAAFSRRGFLGLAGASAGAVVAGAASAEPARGTAGERATSHARRIVVVHDPDLPVSPGLLAQIGAEGAQVVALSGDPVRIWRDGLREQVEGAEALYGLTLWADLVIFQGLAQELRRHVRSTHRDLPSGRIAWKIA